MAVYKQTYVPYEGSLSAERWRFTVLARYAFLAVFESRLLATFFMLCFVPPVLACGILYANHNAKALEDVSANIVGAAVNLGVSSAFFTLVFRVQAFLSFLLITFVAPGLVSADMANSALVVYLSKPFSRGEYVFARMAVLVALTSAITWVPALVLIAVQTDLAGTAWLKENYRLAPAFLLSYWLWIVVISLLGLAVSAFLKWRPIATGCLAALFFAGAGVGVLFNQMLSLRTPWGLLLSLDSAIGAIFKAALSGVDQTTTVPAWATAVWLLLLCLASAILLRRRLQAYEAVH